MNDASLVATITAICWAMLLGGPIITFLAWHLLRHSLCLQHTILVTGSFILLMLVLTAASINTSSASLNQLLCYATYVTYSLLAACTFSIHRLWLRIPVALLLYLPVLAGYLLGTIGALGLCFIIEESFPQEIHPFRPGLVCEVTYWGWAGSDEGDDYVLYRYWPRFPWIRRAVGSLSVDFDSTDGPGGDCNSLFQDYEHRR